MQQRLLNALRPAVASIAKGGASSGWRLLCRLSAQRTASFRLLLLSRPNRRTRIINHRRALARPACQHMARAALVEDKHHMQAWAGMNVNDGVWNDCLQLRVRGACERPFLGVPKGARAYGPRVRQ